MILQKPILVIVRTEDKVEESFAEKNMWVAIYSHVLESSIL